MLSAVPDDALLSSLLAAVAARPADVALRLHVAALLTQQGRPVEAVQQCAAVLALDPANQQAVDLLSTASAALAPAPDPATRRRVPAQSPWCGAVGKPVSAVRRILYVRGGEILPGRGPLEITFQGGDVLLLDGGSDGESLVARVEPWPDPFGGPLSPENAAFVRKAGKWTAFDVSSSPPMARFIGARLRAVEEIRSPTGKTTGATLWLDSGLIQVVVEADELVVDVA